MDKKLLSKDIPSLKFLMSKITPKSGFSPGVYDLSNNDEYLLHSNIVNRIGNNLMAKEFRVFEIDNHNKQILRFLLFYFNQSKIAEEIFPQENYKTHKQIILSGKVGVGKTMLMSIFSNYLRLTNNPNVFHNVSVTEMTNYYKIHNHLDKYTFCELTSERKFNGSPVNLCLNDLGLNTQLHFGVDTKVLIDDFLYSRYELYLNHHKMAHLTTNLSVSELKQAFDYRLNDRFKSYNILEVGESSRRK